MVVRHTSTRSVYTMIGRSVGRVVLRGTGDGSVVAAVATAAAGWGGPLRAAEGQRPGLGLLRRSALCSLSAAATAPTQSPSPVVVVRGREEKRDQDLEGRGRAQNARGRDWTDCTREQIKLQNRLNEIKELLLPAEERWKIASSVMQKAERDGFPLTRIHYGVALGICSRASQLQEALGYLQKIRNLNVGKLNSSNYLHAIVAAGKVADSTIVMDLYRGAREDDCVSLAVRCATMTALGKDGKWEEALELVRTAICPSILSGCVLISPLSYEKMLLWIFRILKYTMLQSRPVPIAPRAKLPFAYCRR